MKPDVSAVIVNFQSAHFTLGAVESLLAERFMVDGRPGTIEVVVVDNASRGEDVTQLLPLVSANVDLVRNTENVGYALANNQGFRVCSGRWHLVVNPDVRIIPGCVSRLIEVLESTPGAGIVGPLATMDEEGLVLLPPNELPDPYRETLQQLARMSAGAATFNARRRAAFAHRYWTATRPVDVEMLSGGCFLGRRSDFLDLGLFDGAYPLYYEDTDLFRRFRERGMRLIHVPDARVAHFFSRSAITRMKAAMYRHDVSLKRYFTRWFGAPGLRVQEVARSRADAMKRDHLSPWPMTDVGPTLEPPVLRVPPCEGAYVEVAGNPQFTLAVGLFPSSPGPYPIPRSFFDQLGPNRYWMRTVDPRTFDTVDAWCVTKGAPA